MHCNSTKLYVFLRPQYLALLPQTTIIPSLHPSCHSLCSRNMVTHSTTIKKHWCILSVVPALHITNFLEGLHFKWRGSQMYLSANSHTKSVPHVPNSLDTSHVLIHPRTTAERSDPVWPLIETWTADQADLAKLGSAQLNLMSLHLTSVWQLPIIEHKIGRHGGHSWKRQRPLDKPDDDNDFGTVLNFKLEYSFFPAENTTTHRRLWFTSLCFRGQQ